MNHCIVSLLGQQTENQRYWRLGTMTCIRFDFYLEHPQLILLTRIFLIISLFLLRFMCFVIGASCSSGFKPQCTAYTVIAAFALCNFLLITIVEFIHFFRLWTYNPTETKNTTERHRYATVSSSKTIEKPHRCHLRFIHHSMVNDQNASGYRQSLCSKGAECQSESLHHQLIYHSLKSARQVSNIFNNSDVQKTIIAFYETTIENMFKIVENGLPCGNNLQLQQGIYFTTSITSNLEPEKGILCARINLGRLKMIKEAPVNLNQYFQGAGGLHDTVYVENLARFYLRMPGQIEKWIVMISSGTKVNDELDSNYYVDCFS
ncbi:unnamed protein product [Rotaria sp. Silwood2]|nr:unnamed protein product [Rotaria sp. Silwood2]